MIILGVTGAACVRILLSPGQFVINDFMPFSRQMLLTCLLPYESAGVGRENPNAVPVFCDFGGLSAVLGGPAAQHLMLAGAFAIAGISMFLLLRRIGNPWQLSLLGALLYEFAPPMLNFQESGWAFLLTSALLPAILLGAVPSDRWPAWVDGMRSGALLALLCYANPQAPVLVAFVLLPVVVAYFLGRNRRASLIFAGTLVPVFLLGAIPVFQILAGYGTEIQSLRSVLLNDFQLRLSRNTVYDFFVPYSFVGLVPVLVGIALIGFRRDVHRAEWAAAVSLLSIISLWEILRRAGLRIAHIVPQIALFKDFIKLQILLALVVTVLSIMALRWLLSPKRRRTSLFARLSFVATRGLLVGGVLLLIAPIALRERAALASGQLGLPETARVPSTYEQVLGGIHQSDRSPGEYRILWLPIDWRFFLSSRSIEPGDLLYYQDAPPAARKAVLDSFNSIASGSHDEIAPLLGQLGVKYIVVDLADGQVPGELWQKGHMLVADVWGTQVLSGAVPEYLSVLNDSPGLDLVATNKAVAVFRNNEWLPILKTYAGALGLDSRSIEPVITLDKRSLPLKWVGYGSAWRQGSDGSVSISAPQSIQDHAWVPVSATFPVVAGNTYQVAGTMQFQNVSASHVKIIWSGKVAAADTQTVVIGGHDGSGTIPTTTVVAAPTGSTIGQLFLMGGWANGGNGLSRFTNFTVTPVLIAPSLSSLTSHVEQRLPLEKELPELLLEPALRPGDDLTKRSETFWLSDTDPMAAQTIEHTVRLITYRDVNLAGRWGVNGVAGPSGLAQFSEYAGGRISIRPGVTSAYPKGSQLIWLEYAKGSAGPAAASLHHETIDSATSASISCSQPSCTIANILVVPPVPSTRRVTRFAEAYSPLLVTPDGRRRPIAVSDDWASVYVPAPRGVPSSAYAPASLIRWLGLAVGHATIGLATIGLALLLGLIRRLDGD
jgi:hypothetical protein